MDPIKDLILLSRMIILLGGLTIVFTHPNLFSSCVSDLKVIFFLHDQNQHVSLKGCVPIFGFSLWATISRNSEECGLKPT